MLFAPALASRDNDDNDKDIVILLVTQCHKSEYSKASPTKGDLSNRQEKCMLLDVKL